MRISFGPDGFHVLIRTMFGFPYRPQHAPSGVEIARTKILFEMGVEESRCSRIYYLATLFMVVYIERHDPKYKPEWMKDAAPQVRPSPTPSPAPTPVASQPKERRTAPVAALTRQPNGDAQILKFDLSKKLPK